MYNRVDQQDSGLDNGLDYGLGSADINMSSVTG